MANGYAGKILYVDLTSGRIEKRDLETDFAERYIGGLGFAARIYLDLIKGKPDFDALAHENPFILMTGPLTGIKMQAVARWTVGTKSPLTGYWGDANIGGYFGAELKFAGYDGIVITGGAKSPKYLFIEDDTVELRDADRYWGKDTYRTNDDLLAEHRCDTGKSGQVFAIGSAGENLVRFSSIVHKKGHVAGRTGMGAVWGSKRLKAIFVRGTGKLRAAHPDRLAKLRQDIKEVHADGITIEALRSYGTQSHIDIGILIGDIPIRNWQTNEWEEIDEIGPIAYSERIGVKNGTCYACAVACKRVAESKEGAFRFEKGPGPEYETVACFGTMCSNSNVESIGKANDLCNRYGMDTISCGATIAFAIECFENGLIDEKDTGGLRLTWGNSAAIVALTEKIGKSQGIGSLLAEGSAKAAERIGKNARDFLTTVKGLEAPMHDPRSAHGLGLAYAVSPRGACHMASLQYPIEGGGMFLPEFPEFENEIEGMTSEGKARINTISQDFGTFFSQCAPFCNLGSMVLNATQALEMINCVTGFEYSLEQVMQLGRRIWYLKRGLSNLFGARAEHDRLPKRLLTAIESGPTAGSVPDMARMMDEFYQMRQLDGRGIPQRGVLEELDLPDLAEMLH